MISVSIVILLVWHFHMLKLPSKILQDTTIRKGFDLPIPPQCADAHQCAAQHFEDILQVWYYTMWLNVYMHVLKSLLVYDPSFRGIVPCRTWQCHTESPLSASSLACPCQVTTPYWRITHSFWWSYLSAWLATMEVPRLQVQRLQHVGVTIWDSHALETEEWSVQHIEHNRP